MSQNHTLYGQIVIIKRTGADGAKFPVTASVCLIGRADNCDIRIRLPNVSKEHCRLCVNENGEVSLTNLSQIHPTLVNGKPTVENVMILHCDVIQIVDRLLRFEFPEGSVHRTATPVSPMKTICGNSPFSMKILSPKLKPPVECQGISVSSLIISPRRKPPTPFVGMASMTPQLEAESTTGSNTSKSKTPNSERKSRSPRRRSRNAATKSPARSKSPTVNTPPSNKSPTVKTPPFSKFPAVMIRDVRSQSKSPLRGNSETTKSSAVERISKSPDSPKLAAGKGSPAAGTSSTVGSIAKPPKQSSRIEKQSPRRRKSLPFGSPRRPIVTPLKEELQSIKRRSVTVQEVSEVSTPTNRTPGKTPGSKSPQSRKRKSVGKEPPSKRKRVSFGVRLSPEFFDKKMPAGKPVQKGSTPRGDGPAGSPAPKVLKRRSIAATLHTTIKEESPLKAPTKGRGRPRSASPIKCAKAPKKKKVPTATLR